MPLPTDIFCITHTKYLLSEKLKCSLALQSSNSKITLKNRIKTHITTRSSTASIIVVCIVRSGAKITTFQENCYATINTPLMFLSLALNGHQFFFLIMLNHQPTQRSNNILWRKKLAKVKHTSVELAFDPTGQRRAQRRSESAVCHFGHNVAGNANWERRKRSGCTRVQRSCVKGDWCLLADGDGGRPHSAPPSTAGCQLVLVFLFVHSSVERRACTSAVDPHSLYSAPHHIHSPGLEQRSAFCGLRFFQLLSKMCFAEWSACCCHRPLAR